MPRYLKGSWEPMFGIRPRGCCVVAAASVVINSFTGLLCGLIWDYFFPSKAMTSSANARIEDSSFWQEVAFNVKFCRQSVELCDVFVACK